MRLTTHFSIPTGGPSSEGSSPGSSRQIPRTVWSESAYGAKKGRSSGVCVEPLIVPPAGEIKNPYMTRFL